MMSPEWQTFLQDAGAVVRDGRVMHFGNPSAEIQFSATGEVIADLSHRALIAVRGIDAEKFLQGQLTGDIRAVDSTNSQLSAHCSPKGRVVALFRVFRRDDTLYLALPGALLESSLVRLRKYVLMSKVTLDAESGLVQAGYAGVSAAQRLHELIEKLPDEVNAVVHSQGITVIRLPGLHPRFELIGPPAALKTLWTRLGVHAAPVGAGPWELLDILAGIPVLHPENVDSFVPQMLNLDILGGISFKKGCYTGQEIVARTHYLGRLKRRMYRLHCASDDPAPPATAIFSSAHRADEGIGAVVAAQPAPQGGTVLLAVLQTEAAAGGELRLGGNNGPLCTVQDLPYSVEAASGAGASL